MTTFLPCAQHGGSSGRDRLLRAAALLLVVAGLVAPARGAEAAPSPRVFHIAPSASGRGDGSSWANAGDLSKLPAFVQAAEPGHEVWLLGGQGSYRVTKPLFIRYGGAPGAPITVRGVAADGSDAATPVLAGTRTSPWNRGGTSGGDVFRLLGGANHLRFTNMAFENQGNGCFYLGGPVRDVTLERMTATNVTRFVENATVSGQATATVTGLVMREVVVRGYSRGVARLQYDTHEVLLEDVYGDSERQQDGSFAMGVHLDGTVHDVVHRRVTMLNSHHDGAEYWNGDGFASERNTYRLTYEDTFSAGHTDGGYDLKSRDTTLTRVLAEDNKRNFRFWGAGIVLQDSRGAGPTRRGGSGSQDQLQALGDATVTVSNSTFTDASPATIVFEVDERAVVTVAGGSVRRAPGSQLSRLDRDAQLHLVGVDEGGAPAVVGNAPTGQYQALATGDRIDGGGQADPVGQAIATSRARFDDGAAQRVVLVTADRFPDALGGSALAGARGAVLYTSGLELEPRTAAEITRLTDGRGGLVVLGGEAAVSSSAAAAALAAAGGTDCAAPLPPSCRIAGQERIETAALAAAVVRAEHPEAPDLAVVARADDVADALTGGAFASAAGVPLLLTARDVASPAARDFLAAARVGEVVALGGTAAVPDDVLAELAGAARRGRVAGPERTATSAAIARELWPRLGAVSGTAVLVNVRHPVGWQTALSAAPLAAAVRAPQLGVEGPPAGLGSEVQGALASLDRVIIAGDEVLVSSSQRLAALDALHGSTGSPSAGGVGARKSARRPSPFVIRATRR